MNIKIKFSVTIHFSMGDRNPSYCLFQPHDLKLTYFHLKTVLLLSFTATDARKIYNVHIIIQRLTLLSPPTRLL